MNRLDELKALAISQSVSLSSPDVILELIATIEALVREEPVKCYPSCYWRKEPEINLKHRSDCPWLFAKDKWLG